MALATQAPFRQFFDIDGLPLQNGYVWFGVADDNPETAPVTVYWDADGTQPAAQPIRTSNGYAMRNGTPGTIFAAAQYSITVRNRRRELVAYAANSADFDISTQLTALFNSISNYSDTAEGDALVAVKHPATGGVSRSQHDKNQDLVHVADFGAVGNGTTDDGPAIVNALAAALTRRVQLHFDGAKTYRIASSSWAIAAGARLVTNGCTINCDATSTGNGFWLTIADDVEIDKLYINVPTGVRRDRVVSYDSDGGFIGHLKIHSVDQQANSEADDGALHVLNGLKCGIGIYDAKNYDRPLVVHDADDCTITRFYCESYVRGAYLYDNVNLQINGGRAHTASPNASATAGHNAMLLGCTATNAQRDVFLRDFIAEDAGEHAFRIGGPKQQSGIHLIHCTARRAGGNAVKVLGTDAGVPTARNKNILIDHLTVEDCGTDGGLSALNRAGVLLKYCDFVQVPGLIVRSVNETYSAAYGVVADAVTNVQVPSPLVNDTQFDGVILYAVDGDVDFVQISGGTLTGNARHGVNVTVGTGMTMRRVMIDGVNLDSNGDLGFDVDVNGTLVAGYLRAKTNNNTGGSGACNTINMTLDVSTNATEIALTPLSGITARNGSLYDDGTNKALRKGGAWVNL
jgi:hypothetical protein